jgi:NTP pyrophosphatase (non-canonical NTP hydrolase)
MNFRKLQKEIHQNAKDKGFYDNIDNIPVDINIAKWICLMHSELSEALESIRNGLSVDAKHGLAEEFADTVIRIMDTCEYLGIDLEQKIIQKHYSNKKREYKHGKNF